MKAEKERFKLVEFFRSEYGRLVGYVRKMIDDTAARDGEDIVQEVILNAFNLTDGFGTMKAKRLLKPISTVSERKNSQKSPQNPWGRRLTTRRQFHERVFA